MDSDPTHCYVTFISNASHKLVPTNRLAAFAVNLEQLTYLHSNTKWKDGICETTFKRPNARPYWDVKTIGATNALMYYELITQTFQCSHDVSCLCTFIYDSIHCNHIFEVYYHIPEVKGLLEDIEIEILTQTCTPAPFNDNSVTN
jgi:hypothetical protein